MRWKPFVEHLRSRCSHRRVSTPAGSILQPTKALDLELVIMSFLEPPDKGLKLAVMGLQSLLSKVGSRDSLLTFRWGTYVRSIDFLDVGGSEVFVCFDSDEDAYRVTAALDPKDEPSITQELVQSYFKDNGRSYGVELFGCLPNEMLNRRPDLLPAAIVKEACWNWLLWAEREEGTAWVNLRDSVVSWFEAPEGGEHSGLVGQMAHVLTLAFAGSSIEERLEDFAKRREQEEKELSLDDRRIIFENYFTLSYREEDPRKSSRRPR